MSNSIKTFLKPLKTARIPGELQLAPGINKQLKSVARQLRENDEHIVLFTGASETEKNYAANFIGKSIGRDTPCRQIFIPNPGFLSSEIHQFTQNVKKLAIKLLADSVIRKHLPITEYDGVNK